MGVGVGAVVVFEGRHEMLSGALEGVVRIGMGVYDFVGSGGELAVYQIWGCTVYVLGYGGDGSYVLVGSCWGWIWVLGLECCWMDVSSLAQTSMSLADRGESDICLRACSARDKRKTIQIQVTIILLCRVITRFWIVQDVTSAQKTNGRSEAGYLVLNSENQRETIITGTERKERSHRRRSIAELPPRSCRPRIRLSATTNPIFP